MSHACTRHTAAPTRALPKCGTFLSIGDLPGGGLCPYAVNSSLHSAWLVGRHDADMRYVLALPYAERGRAVAYLHGYWSGVIKRSGPGFPLLSSSLLDAAWECGERAAGGNVDDGAVVLLGAMVEDAFRRAYDIGRRGGA